MNVPVLFAETQLQFVWLRARPEAKAIIILLGVASIFVWGTMIAKAMQMRRALRLAAALAVAVFDVGVRNDGRIRLARIVLDRIRTIDPRSENQKSRREFAAGGFNKG